MSSVPIWEGLRFFLYHTLLTHLFSQFPLCGESGHLRSLLLLGSQDLNKSGKTEHTVCGGTMLFVQAKKGYFVVFKKKFAFIWGWCCIYLMRMGIVEFAKSLARKEAQSPLFFVAFKKYHTNSRKSTRVIHFYLFLVKSVKVMFNFPFQMPKVMPLKI